MLNIKNLKVTINSIHSLCNFSLDFYQPVVIPQSFLRCFPGVLQTKIVLVYQNRFGTYSEVHETLSSALGHFERLVKDSTCKYAIAYHNQLALFAYSPSFGNGNVYAIEYRYVDDKNPKDSFTFNATADMADFVRDEAFKFGLLF